ncbi:hypothetical protein TTHERM_000860431 (macronuclear) [Tetrahymena thermophila SB210]|uniref:Uncharacterized protein n=1 Tax=Tetrahymena thermophila (strain SB210) TaxID=312017 RepID=W7XC86_TETTS|nr:hypothetical protein TTHERM_000860431 [Tetrahymena thermophila SB210]EWS74138.1 hypothetical protein TTHERM_000860431 [Tetrahymena thermophila SB210]|eukprot:XP_012653323.1 hypothetical protein TTHERM_000860431 [Tetrahymena thermophila SB210]
MVISQILRIKLHLQDLCQKSIQYLQQILKILIQKLQMNNSNYNQINKNKNQINYNKRNLLLLQITCIKNNNLKELRNQIQTQKDLNMIIKEVNYLFNNKKMIQTTKKFRTFSLYLITKAFKAYIWVQKIINRNKNWINLTSLLNIKKQIILKTKNKVKNNKRIQLKYQKDQKILKNQCRPLC